MKYIKTFDAHSDYLDFKESDEMVYPNILACREEEHVHVDFPKAPIVPLTFIATSAPGNIGPFRTESDYAAVIKLMHLNSDGGGISETPTPILQATSSPLVPFLYSINGGEWEKCEYIQYDSQTSAGTFNCIWIALENIGDRVSLKLDIDELQTMEGINALNSLNGEYNFSIDGYASAEGDVTSLLNGEGGDCELGEGAFVFLFESCEGLITAPNLPSTNINEGCYHSMFGWCTNLISGPQILPATELADYCYDSMFYNCTSLENAPELPALYLVQNCYNNMFYNCTNLEYIKALFLTNPEEQQLAKSSSYPYTYNWTVGVSDSGFFEGNPDATWCCRGEDGIPVNWDTNMPCAPLVEAEAPIDVS